MTEYITNIPVEKLKPFPNHPFQVRDDDSMRETVESIKTYGVLQPAIVRPSDDGNYEILSGHRRKHACELAGRKTIPAIVRELDDDAAIIFEPIKFFLYSPANLWYNRIKNTGEPKWEDQENRRR